MYPGVGPKRYCRCPAAGFGISATQAVETSKGGRQAEEVGIFNRAAKTLEKVEKQFTVESRTLMVQASPILKFRGNASGWSSFCRVPRSFLPQLFTSSES
jgi:hypothetical protein